MADARALILDRLPRAGFDGDLLAPGRPDRLPEADPQPLHLPDLTQPENEVDRGTLGGPGRPPWVERVTSADAPLSDEDLARVESEYLEFGLDVLAWYVSPRFGGPWGIFIRDGGVALVAQALATRSSPATSQATMAMAAEALFFHEYFHFLVDVGVSGIERIVRTGLYTPLLRAQKARAPGYDQLEEALANAFAVEQSRSAVARRRLCNFLSAAPVGYRDFGPYLGAGPASRGRRRLLTQYSSAGATGPAAAPLELLLDVHGGLLQADDVPVHLVRDRPAAHVLKLITSLPDLEDAPAFKRQLKKLPQHVQAEWTRTRASLQQDISALGSFKRLTGRPGVYSVRVTHDYRALLERSGDGWTVVAIKHRRETYAA
jgi:hypothetical protein